VVWRERGSVGGGNGDTGEYGGKGEFLVLIGEEKKKKARAGD